MKPSRKILLLTTALVGVGGIALAAGITLPTVSTISAADQFPIIPNGQPTAQSMFMTMPQLRSAVFTDTATHTGAPALTGCVTSGGTIVGTDYAFTLAQGSAANTSCIATFSAPFLKTPVCLVTPVGTTFYTSGLSFAVSTVAITLTQTSASSQTYSVHCASQPGG